jgi:mRNA-degrading endonuclease HigB of HigAB toxin-antitoxin module
MSSPSPRSWATSSYPTFETCPVLSQTEWGQSKSSAIGAKPRGASPAWFDEESKAEWVSSADVKRLYATASIVNAERIVFNIKGNDYRLVVSVDFEKGIV